MEIIFNEKPGSIFDFFQAVYFVYNRCAEEQLNKYGLSWNKQVKKAFDYLEKNVDVDKPELDLFFSRDTHGFFAFYSSPSFWVCDSIENFIKTLDSHTDEELKEKLSRHLGIFGDMDDIEMKKILNDEKKILEFIDRLGKPASTKWEAFKFLQQPKIYMQKVIAFLSDFAKKYELALGKYGSQLDTFNLSMKEIIETQGRTLLETEYQRIISLDKCEYVFISSAFMCNFTVSVDNENEGKTLYLYLGIDYKEVLSHLSGRNEIEHTLTVLKVLSDPTRFEIISQLMERPLYGQEISERLGLTMATVSHHMELLSVAAKLVKQEISGRRVYYSLNKDELSKGLEFIKQKFQLE